MLLVVSLEQNGASWPFLIAATWTAIIQLGMAVVGTFIIKRFSTPFSVGFLLGMVIFVAQQQLMLAVTFWHTRYGDFNTNIVFSNFSFALFVVYSFFGCILQNYREDIMVAAVDAKGFGRRKASEDRSVTDA
jgi:zinc transporter ZupT